MDKDEVILGSGKVYLVECKDNIVPADEVLEVIANSVGRVKGGASLEYKPTIYEVTDDDNNVVKRFITKEEITFKSGIMTWDLKTLAKLTPHKVIEDGKMKTLKIGGSKSLASYALRFVHTKDDGTKLRITMVATAGNGFNLKFEGAKETVIDAEFKALSQKDGTLVEIKEDILQII